MVTKVVYIGGGNAPSPITLDEMSGILKVPTSDIIFRGVDESPRGFAKEFAQLNEGGKPRLDGILVCLYSSVEESNARFFRALEKAGAEVRDSYSPLTSGMLDDLTTDQLKSWIGTGDIGSGSVEDDDPFGELFEGIDDEPILAQVPAEKYVQSSTVEELSTPAPYAHRDLSNGLHQNIATVRDDEPPLPDLKNQVTAPVAESAPKPVETFHPEPGTTSRPRDSRGAPPIFGSQPQPQQQYAPVAPVAPVAQPVMTPPIVMPKPTVPQQPIYNESPVHPGHAHSTYGQQGTQPIPQNDSLSDDLFGQRPQSTDRDLQPGPSIATRFSESEINRNFDSQQQNGYPQQNPNYQDSQQGWAQQPVPQNPQPGYAQQQVNQHPGYVQHQQQEMQQNVMPPYMQRLDPDQQFIQSRVEKTYDEAGYTNPRMGVQMKHGPRVTYITASRGGCGKSSLSYILANALSIAVSDFNSENGTNRQVWLVEVDYGNPKLEERYQSQGRNIGNIARLYESANGLTQEQLINAIQANAIFDPETKLNIMACPYDLQSSQAAVSWLGHAISEVVKILRARFNAHVILDAGTMTTAKYNPLDGTLAGPVSDVAVVVGMPENVADTQRSAELLREPPISKSIVNIHIFANFSDDKQFYEMDSQMGQFNVSGRWPDFPEIHQKWVGTAASPETTSAMVIRAAQFLKNIGYEEVDGLIQDHVPTRRRRNLFDRVFKR